MSVRKVDCFITESLEDGPAFAVRADNGEAVFIPKAMAEKMELVEMDEITALIQENTVQPDKTPWFAIKAVKKEA